jgi:hypothetical protein
MFCMAAVAAGERRTEAGCPLRRAEPAAKVRATKSMTKKTMKLFRISAPGGMKLFYGKERRFQGFKVSRFQGFKVSRFQGCSCKS